MFKKISATLAICCVSSSTLFAWSNHYLFYHSALEALPDVQNAQPIAVEKLEDFLLKEQATLIPLMKQIEDEAKISHAKKAPQPDALAFAGGDASSVRANFLRALRVNAKTPLGYFLQQLPGKPLPGPRSSSTSVNIFGDKDVKRVYEFYDIKPGQKVSALEVLATAGDEPDFGLDINLFTDNNTDASKEYGYFGADYGFGEQSFGDAKLYYGSQAPFHIGYYHESGIIYAAAGFLKRTYPRYRVHQFLSLARFAFKTGHPYWGYRFLGWGLHYVGDLTQPYHARVLPNYGAMGMLWINIKSMIGFGAAKAEAIERISKRHTTIEKYHFTILQRAYADKKFDHPFIANLKLAERDATYGEYNEDYLVDVLTKESHGVSDRVDTLIDESNLLTGFSEGNVLPEINKDKLAELDSVIAQHMQGVGSHVRNYVRAGLK